MISTTSLLRTRILQTARPATHTVKLIARSAAVRGTNRNFSSSQRCLCANCANSGIRTFGRHENDSRGSSSNITNNIKTRNIAGKTAAYATITNPLIPTEQWAQVLEQTGGRKFSFSDRKLMGYQLSELKLWYTRRSPFQSQLRTRS